MNAITVLFADPRITVQRRVRWWRISGRSKFSKLVPGHVRVVAANYDKESEGKGTDRYWL